MESNTYPTLYFEIMQQTIHGQMASIQSTLHIVLFQHSKHQFFEDHKVFLLTFKVKHSKGFHMQLKVYHLCYKCHSNQNLLILDYTYNPVEYSKVLCHDALLQVHSDTQLHLVVVAGVY